MGLKKIIKRAGRSFFSLKQDDEAVFRQRVLVIDNGYCSVSGLREAVKRTQYFFPGAKVVILALASRGGMLQEEFSHLERIICSSGIRPKRYRIALQLLFLRNKKFDYIVNFSLDPSPLAVELFFFRHSRVMLYNQWGQWCSLKLRKLSQIFDRSYHKQPAKGGWKNWIKRLGLFFVLVKVGDEEALSHKVLIVDESGRIVSQLIYALRRVKESLPCCRLQVLTDTKAREIERESHQAQFIRPDKFFLKKYRLARHMLKLRKNDYDYLILLSLDISPIAIGALFTRSRLLLNNQWHQWWSISLKPVSYYAMLPLRFLSQMAAAAVIVTFLGINVAGIYLLRAFNVFKTNLLHEGNR